MVKATPLILATFRFAEQRERLTGVFFVFFFSPRIFSKLFYFYQFLKKMDNFNEESNPRAVRDEVAEFPTYEDYLDSQIMEKDLKYLQVCLKD